MEDLRNASDDLSSSDQRSSEQHVDQQEDDSFRPGSALSYREHLSGTSARNFSDIALSLDSPPSVSAVLASVHDTSLPQRPHSRRDFLDPIPLSQLPLLPPAGIYQQSQHSVSDDAEQREADLTGHADMRDAESDNQQVADIGDVDIPASTAMIRVPSCDSLGLPIIPSLPLTSVGDIDDATLLQRVNALLQVNVQQNVVHHVQAAQVNVDTSSGVPTSLPIPPSIPPDSFSFPRLAPSHHLPTRLPKHLWKRVKEVEAIHKEKIFRATKQLLVLRSTLFRLQTMKQDDKIPKSLQVSIPTLHIDTLGITIPPSDDMKQVANTVSAHLLDCLIARVGDENKVLADKLDSLLPVNSHDGFLRYKTVVLGFNDKALESEIPVVEVFSERISSDFDHLLHQTFAHFVYNMQLAIFEARDVCKKSKGAVRAYLKRNEPTPLSDIEMVDAILEPNTSVQTRQERPQRASRTTQNRGRSPAQRGRGRSQKRSTSRRPSQSPRQGPRSKNGSTRTGRKSKTRRNQRSATPKSSRKTKNPSRKPSKPSSKKNRSTSKKGKKNKTRR